MMFLVSMKGNRPFPFIILFIFLFAIPASSQKTKNQLEHEKKENLKKIAEAEKILTQTLTQKKATLGQLQALNQQISARLSLIRSIGTEIRLLDAEISDLSEVVISLKNDLKVLKEEYAVQIYSSYKANRGNSKLMFLFSSKSFNQLLQRLKYLEQYAEARRLQAEQIELVTKDLDDQRSKVETKRAEQQILLNQQIRENRKLASSKKNQSALVTQLAKKELQLRRELDKRKAANRRLNSLIANTIEAEKKKNSNASTAEIASAAELTRLFESNKNKLSWPVNSGFITSKFGRQQHPVLKRITVINDGVGIQTEKNSRVKSVFDGEVTLIGTIQGKNNIVVIRHGDYLTVYARLRSINVKKGQRVKANDIIGEVYTDRDGVTELEFQVYKGTTKLNPENWLALK
ncbi:MAG: peptidoglycan DD-metalloendopeptidase family protein [Bacteroidota bacterium]